MQQKPSFNAFKKRRVAHLTLMRGELTREDQSRLDPFPSPAGITGRNPHQNSGKKASTSSFILGGKKGSVQTYRAGSKRQGINWPQVFWGKVSKQIELDPNQELQLEAFNRMHG